MSIPIGTCSNCGGRVVAGSEHLTAHCERCGAVPVHTDGPVIPMRPRGEIVPPAPGQGPSWRHEDELVEWPGGSRILDNLLRKTYPKGGIL